MRIFLQWVVIKILCLANKYVIQVIIDRLVEILVWKLLINEDNFYKISLFFNNFKFYIRSRKDKCNEFFQSRWTPVKIIQFFVFILITHEKQKQESHPPFFFFKFQN